MSLKLGLIGRQCHKKKYSFIFYNILTQCVSHLYNYLYRFKFCTIFEKYNNLLNKIMFNLNDAMNHFYEILCTYADMISFTDKRTEFLNNRVTTIQNVTLNII